MLDWILHIKHMKTLQDSEIDNDEDRIKLVADIDFFYQSSFRSIEQTHSTIKDANSFNQASMGNTFICLLGVAPFIPKL